MPSGGMSGIFLTQTTPLPRRLTRAVASPRPVGKDIGDAPQGMFGTPSPTATHRASVTTTTAAQQPCLRQGLVAADSASPQKPAAARVAAPAAKVQRSQEAVRGEAEKVRTLREVSRAIVAAQRLQRRGRGPGTEEASSAPPSRGRPDHAVAPLQAAAGKLAAARAAHKAQVHAVQRARTFTHSMMRKIDGACEDLMSCSTDCGESSPSTWSSLDYDSSSPRDFGSLM